MNIFSNACLNGWGTAGTRHSACVHWTEKESICHKNVLENVAALFAIRIYF